MPEHQFEGALVQNNPLIVEPLLDPRNRGVVAYEAIVGTQK
jgi:hypothetical protein